MIMIDSIGTILIATTMAVVFAAFISTIPVGLSWRLTIAGVAGAWVGLAIAIVEAGGLANPARLGALFTFPLLAAAGLSLAFPAVRSALLAIPVQLLIGLNVFRIIGVQFLVLASVGRLAGPFPQSAGWGDILVGALALPVAILALRKPASDVRILAWNTFGVLDLVVAVMLGVTSASGSPLQLIHAGVGSAAIQTLPWSLIPTVLVPFFLISHGIIFARARSRATTARRERSSDSTLANAPNAR
jgi:hypothetical protein